MSLLTTIKDPASGVEAEVTQQNALKVVQQIYPPLEPDRRTIFAQYLTDDGTPTGSKDMDINASSTPVEFWIPSSENRHRFITMVSFVISDPGAAMNEFGALSELTNGCIFEYETLSETVTIATDLTTNFLMLRMANFGKTQVGEGNTSMRLNNVSGNAEAFVPIVDFRDYIPPYGIRLEAGSTQKLVFTIQDNLNGLSRFDAYAIGFEQDIT